MFTRRSLLAFGMASGFVIQAKAQASNWPDRPVRMIIGYPAGGPTDFPGRLLQEPLQRLWGQPVVVENRPGASQMIASEAVARSAPDGYTIFLAASTHTSNAAVHPRLPYDTINDFTPIVNIYASATVLFTGTSQPYRTAQDLVAAARREPGFAFASSGVGSSGHFALEMFRRKLKLDITHVPYRGAVPALQDVMGGRVPGTFSTLSGAIALTREGKIRPLAIAGPQRVQVLPDVPTLDELGMGIPDTSPWYGFIAPKGLQRDIVDRIARDVQGLLRDPVIRQRLIDQGGVILGEGPEAFTQRIARELAENIVVARESNIRVE
jgi:tripartite-type tricarboxylate transporter receptor subunit TctC